MIKPKAKILNEKGYELYVWITAQKDINPNIDIKDSINAFLDYNQIDREKYECYKIAYYNFIKPDNG